MKPTQTQWQHLYWRAGFGASWADLQKLKQRNLQVEVRRLVNDGQKEPKKIVLLQGQTPKLAEAKQLSTAEKKALRKKLRLNVPKLNAAWIQEMQHSSSPLREKMAFFWHTHFACKHKNVYYAQIQLHLLRKNALGNFREMLHAIAKDPAMITFLNNQQNKKDQPNENFARELMELFTLGRGNYTEQDIKESARAFTGWAAHGDDFLFRIKQHDFDSKTFFGKTGNFHGEDIIEMILAKKETALFITNKLYKFLVNENINQQLTGRLADDFYQSNYDIAKLVEQMLVADWFYAPENIGTQIKSPVQLLVGMGKQLGMRFGNEFSPLFIQKILGQVIFDPPNVAGWKGGKSWIDSATLMFRLRLPEFIIKAAEIGIQNKEEDDAQKEDLKGNGFRSLSAEIHWEVILDLFKNNSKKQIYEQMQAYLLQTNPQLNQQAPWTFIQASQTEEQFKEIVAWLLAMPEYQLC